MNLTWNVTAWRCKCHGYRFGLHPREGRWYAFNAEHIRVLEERCTDLVGVCARHPDLVPIEVDNVEALLADVFESSEHNLPVILAGLLPSRQDIEERRREQ